MRVHHIAFRTRDLGRLVRFYTEVLGLEERSRDGERSVWLELDGVILMLERADGDEPGVVSGTNELVAFAIEPERVGFFRERFAMAGVSVESETGFTIYLRDPDGRRVGVSHYPVPKA